MILTIPTKKANKPKKHHYVPRFYLKNWSMSDGCVYVFTKKNGSRNLKKVSTKDICSEKNLYTKRRGNVDVEKKFLADLDDKASKALSALIKLGPDRIAADEKKNFARFINTLHFRHPDFVNEMREYSETRRQRGLEWAEKVYVQSGEDIRHLFKKEKYDDSPAVMEYHADDGLEIILNAHWELLFNNSPFEFLTSDFPLRLVQISGSVTHGLCLPEKFLLSLPLNPHNILLISNVATRLRNIKTMPMEDLVKKANLATVKQSYNIVISSTLSLENFILKHAGE